MPHFSKSSLAGHCWIRLPLRRAAEDRRMGLTWLALVGRRASSASNSSVEAPLFRAFATIVYVTRLMLRPTRGLQNTNQEGARNQQMRKIILDIAVSLDGRIEGPNGELDWLRFDDEMARFTNEQLLADIDAIFYGRRTFEVFGAQTSDPSTSEPQRRFQEAVTRTTKYVFSRSPKKAEGNTNFVTGDLKSAVREIASHPGKNIWLSGGAALVTSCAVLGLIDEYRLSIHPVVLGSGKPLFKGMATPVDLKLVATTTLRNGVIAVQYEPIRPA